MLPNSNNEIQSVIVYGDNLKGSVAFVKPSNILLQKIRNKSAIVGVIGMGYVGLPLALSFTENGFGVIGFDIDLRKIDMLNSGKNYFKHISSARVAALKNNKSFTATNDFSMVSKADAVIICLPTPLNKHFAPDLSYVISTIELICPYLRKEQIISLESTTYPGTTDEELKPRIEQQGLIIGQDVFLVFSPEREDPGNTSFTTSTTPKVVGGHTAKCLEMGVELYKMIVNKVVPVSSTRVAEMTKLLENIYRAVNIGLVNEMKIVTSNMGIDIWEVIDAASTKPFGFTAFYPGPGLGGHCIPIDPFYLTWKAQEYGVRTRFIELAGEINISMPEWVIKKITDALNERGKSIKGSIFLVMGIAYKKNIDDMRESPAVHLIKLLNDKGGIVKYSDPYVPSFPKMREYHFDLCSVEITKSLLRETDCVIIATDHDVFDYEFILENAPLVADTRGRYRNKYNNVVKC